MKRTDPIGAERERYLCSIEVYKLFLQMQQHQTKPCISTFLVMLLDEWLVFTPQSSHLSHFRYKDTNPTRTMKFPRVLILLILTASGQVILTASARGEDVSVNMTPPPISQKAPARGDQDILMDEDIKEMTLDDIGDINTESSGFDIVDERILDEEMNADPDQDPVKKNWIIVVICCLVAFIIILLTLGVIFLFNLHKKGKQVLISAFLALSNLSYCIVFSQSRQEKEVRGKVKSSKNPVLFQRPSHFDSFAKCY